MKENILVIDVQIMNLRKITKWKEVQGGENNVYAYPNGTVSIIFSENIQRYLVLELSQYFSFKESVHEN